MLRGTENWGARVWSGRSCEGAPATQIKCVSPRDRLPSSVDMPAVHQTELEVASCHPGLAASGMQGPEAWDCVSDLCVVGMRLGQGLPAPQGALQVPIQERLEARPGDDLFC